MNKEHSSLSHHSINPDQGQGRATAAKTWTLRSSVLPGSSTRRSLVSMRNLSGHRIRWATVFFLRGRTYNTNPLECSNEQGVLAFSADKLQTRCLIKVPSVICTFVLLIFCTFVLPCTFLHQVVIDTLSAHTDSNRQELIHPYKTL